MTQFHEGQEVEAGKAYGGDYLDIKWRKAKIIRMAPDGASIFNPVYEVLFLDNTRALFDSAHIRKRRYSYDPRCGEVASHFLDAPTAADALTPDFLVGELAQHIQDSIEGWLSSEQERIEAAKAKGPAA